MSIQGLFDKIGITKIVDDKTAAEIGDIVESSNYHGADIKLCKIWVGRAIL